MSLLRPEDFVDFPGYEARLKQLKNLIDQFAQSNVEAVSRVKTSYDSLQEDLGGIIQQINKTNVAQKAAGTTLAQYDQELQIVGVSMEKNRKLLGNLTDAEQAQREMLKATTDRLRDLQKQYETLDPKEKGYLSTKKKIASEIKTLLSVMKAQDSALKSSKSSMDAAVGSYDRAAKQLAEMKAQLKGMPDAFN